MSGDFDRKARVVADAWKFLVNDPEWRPALKAHDLGFPYAFLHVCGDGTLNEKGRQFVEGTYDFLLESCKIEDGDYQGWTDMVAASPFSEA